MWWLNAEVWVEILDGLAFLLVTPEFLKETTLDSLRPKIVDRTEGNFASLVFLSAYTVLCAAGLDWVVRHFYASHASWTELFRSGVLTFVGYYLAGAVLLSQCVYGAVVIVLALAVHVAYRRRMLVIGAVVFFAARALATINAAHHGA